LLLLLLLLLFLVVFQENEGFQESLGSGLIGVYIVLFFSMA
jgi:hypothetical protein